MAAHAALASLVPHLAAHLVKGVGGPGHDVEGVDAHRGVGAALGARPRRSTRPRRQRRGGSAHSAPRRAGRRSRAGSSCPCRPPPRRGAPSRGRRRWSGSDGRACSRSRRCRSRVSPSKGSWAARPSATTRSMMAPTLLQAIAHQLADRGLGRVGDQPGHRVVEVAGVAGPVAGPGHLGDGRAVRRAVHPRRIGLEEAPQRARGRAPASCADPRPGHNPVRAPRSVRNGAWWPFSDAHGRRPCRTPRRSPRPRSPSPGRHRAPDAIRWHRTTPSSSSRSWTFKQPENVEGDGVVRVKTRSGHPRISQESPFSTG